MNISAVQGVRDEIATRLNEAETDNTDIYTNWIHQSLRDIEISFPDAPFLHASADRTLSSGTRVYTNLPTNLRKMNAVIYPAGDTKLNYLPPEIFDTLQPSATEGGSPNTFTIRGLSSVAQIEFYPQIAASITVHYDYQLALDTVSAGSATLNIPITYIELPILWGESIGLRRKGLYMESRLVREEYEALKNKMITDLRKMTAQPPRMISVREFSKNPKFSDPIVNQFWGNNP